MHHINKKQENEFSYYAAEYNPTTKNITYNAPSGLHDDTVMATMFALHGYNEFKQNGNYQFGFLNKNKNKKDIHIYGKKYN